MSTKRCCFLYSGGDGVSRASWQPWWLSDKIYVHELRTEISLSVHCTTVCGQPIWKNGCNNTVYLHMSDDFSCCSLCIPLGHVRGCISGILWLYQFTRNKVAIASNIELMSLGYWDPLSKVNILFCPIRSFLELLQYCTIKICVYTLRESFYASTSSSVGSSRRGKIGCGLVTGFPGLIA